MADYRLMFDKDFLFAAQLQGREVTVEIASVKAGAIRGEGGKSSKKPVCHFRGKDKPLALNVTNCRTIAAMYGPDTKDWIGKRITIYPTTTDFGGKTVDCIRVRPGIPSASKQTDTESTAEEQREPGQDG